MRFLTPGFFVCCALSAATLLATPAPGFAAGADSTATAEVAATVAGRAVTLAEVDRRAATQLARVRQEQYEVRAQALDAILDQEVLQREADASHVAIERLLETEVASKQPAPTPAEIDTFFVHNRGELGGRTLEQAVA